MSSSDAVHATQKLTGKLAGTGATVEVRYAESIQGIDDVIDGNGIEELVAPGFIDLQVNGFAGVDYNDPASTPEAIAGSIRRMFETGVTRFFPTIITGSEERIVGALRNLAAAKEEFRRAGAPEGDAVEAFHVEGPHLSPETGPRGAHPLEHIRPPDIEEFLRMQEAANGMIRLVTVSPEWEQTPSYIAAITKNGVVASIGHTKATTEQIQAAVDAGATMSTHLGNAAHSTLPKTQNYIWDQLAEDRLTASFIVDGIHIPGTFFRAAVRAKGPEKSVLVTDAVTPAMCPPGPYKLGQVDVELLDDGSVVLRGESRLAGSALRMDDAIGNSVRFSRQPLAVVLAMATTNPARVGRIPGRMRGMTPGERADVVRFAWDAAKNRVRVLQTIVAGRSVYELQSAANAG